MSFASALSDLFSCGRSRKQREAESGTLEHDDNAAASEPTAHQAPATPAAPPVEEKTSLKLDDHALPAQEDASRIPYTALPDIRPTTATNWIGDFAEDREVELSVVPEKAKPSAGWVVEKRVLVTAKSSSTTKDTDEAKTSVPQPEPETTYVAPPVRCPTPEQEPWNSTPAARSPTPEPVSQPQPEVRSVSPVARVATPELESELEVRSVSPVARAATPEAKLEPELEAQFLADPFEFAPFWSDETALELEVKQFTMPAEDKVVEPVAEPEIVEPTVTETVVVEPVAEPTVVEPTVAEPVVEPTVVEPTVVEPQIVAPVILAPKKTTPPPTLLNMPPGTSTA